MMVTNSENSAGYSIPQETKTNRTEAAQEVVTVRAQTENASAHASLIISSAVPEPMIIDTESLSQLQDGSPNGQYEALIQDASDEPLIVVANAANPIVPVGESLVGRYLSIVWPNDDLPYGARVVRFNESEGTHTVSYDEHGIYDVEDIDLTNGSRKWNFEPEPFPFLDNDPIY
eukprot:IDg17396t1